MNSEHREPGKALTVVGLGYVGLPLATRACEAGFDVVGFDIDMDRTRRLTGGDSFSTDVPAERLRSALDSGRLRITCDLDELGPFDYCVITVPTPLADGTPDLHFIEEAVEMIVPHLRRDATVVLESTTYPGTTRQLVLPILERVSGLTAGSDFSLGYSPERIDPGNTSWLFETTPKIIAGIDEPSLKRVSELYTQLVDEVFPVSSTETAEMAKLLENTFRHVNIALVNELAMFAGSLGADIWEAIDAASSKPFGFMRFEPGPGVGGHCLPIDPSYLSWQVKRSAGATFRFVELANDVNDHMPDYVVQRLMLGLNRRKLAMNGCRILVLGAAYKRNTSDTRESPFQKIVPKLLELGAEIRAVDPHVESWTTQGVTVTELSSAELEAADAVLILVDHDAFDLDLVAEHAQYVLDTRRCTQGDNVEYL